MSYQGIVHAVLILEKIFTLLSRVIFRLRTAVPSIAAIAKQAIQMKVNSGICIAGDSLGETLVVKLGVVDRLGDG